MKKTCKANLPAMIFLFALLILWQAGAMGLDAAYILPSPTQILAKLWELRDVLFTVHLPATMLVTAIGLGISLVLGLALAVVMDWHRCLCCGSAILSGARCWSRY